VEIRDRLKDVIISGGENISSVEVEGVLLRHPAVQEVAIVGMPDERWATRPHAFVVLEAGATATETELRNYARDLWRTSSVPNESNLRPSCRKQPPATFRSMSFAASVRFRSSDRPSNENKISHRWRGRA
jgi:acyl-CoA synthetase (AMP-forming)/AMP-acid ligase II